MKKKPVIASPFSPLGGEKVPEGRMRGGIAMSFAPHPALRATLSPAGGERGHRPLSRFLN